MKLIFIHVLVYFFFLSRFGSEGNGKFCPSSKIANKAGSTFDTNISIFNCTTMCEWEVCLLGVSTIPNYSLSIVDCITLNIRGYALLGEVGIKFDYNFTCSIFDPPPSRYFTASLLLRGVEMEIVLMSEKENNFTEIGSTVELSCFSHLNDSSDLSVTFTIQRQYSYSLNITCSQNITGCVSPSPDVDWMMCRNKTAPHNCFLILPNFSDSDSGNYSCSMTLDNGDVLESNDLDLQALRVLQPASSLHSPTVTSLEPATSTPGSHALSSLEPTTSAPSSHALSSLEPTTSAPSSHALSSLEPTTSTPGSHALSSLHLITSTTVDSLTISSLQPSTILHSESSLRTQSTLSNSPSDSINPTSTPRKGSSKRSSSSRWLVGLGSSVGALLIIMVVIVLIINAVRTRQRSNQEQYQMLRNQDNQNEDDVHTPASDSLNIERTSVNEITGEEDDTTERSTRDPPPHPVVTLEQSPDDTSTN